MHLLQVTSGNDEDRGCSGRADVDVDDCVDEVVRVDGSGTTVSWRGCSNSNLRLLTINDEVRFVCIHVPVDVKLFENIQADSLET